MAPSRKQLERAVQELEDAIKKRPQIAKSRANASRTKYVCSELRAIRMRIVSGDHLSALVGLVHHSGVLLGMRILPLKEAPTLEALIKLQRPP